MLTDLYVFCLLPKKNTNYIVRHYEVVFLVHEDCLEEVPKVIVEVEGDSILCCGAFSSFKFKCYFELIKFYFLCSFTPAGNKMKP